MSDVDFAYSDLCGAELEEAIASYAQRVMDEAYSLDRQWSQGCQEPSSLYRNQACAEQVLREKLASYGISVPAIRFRYGRHRGKSWAGGMTCG